MPMEVSLDLGLPLPGQQPASQGQAEHLLAVEKTQEIDDQIAQQDAGQAAREGQRAHHLAVTGQDGREDDGRFLRDRQPQPTQDQDQGDPHITKLSDQVLGQPRLPIAPAQ